MSMHRNYFFSSLFFALIFASQNLAQSATRQVAGFGALFGCHDWNFANNPQNKGNDNVANNHIALEQWALGFLNGVSIYGDTDIFARTSESAVESWLDKHCASNPEQTMTDALKDYVSAFTHN